MAGYTGAPFPVLSTWRLESLRESLHTKFLHLAHAKNYRFVDFAMHRVRMLVHFGVIPYIVFDGDHLPSKAETEKIRAARRKESRTTGLELLRLGKTAQAYQELQKAVDVTPEMARQLIEELKLSGIKYVVAPYEADSQLAYLEREGLIEAILSEDSDLLVFGAKCLITKLDQYGECVVIRQADFTACREISLAGWTTAEFRQMAILSGCDYLDGIHRMGLKTAHRFVRKYKTIDRVIRGAQVEGKFRFPTGYLESFTQADKTFLYQWVFCPQSKCLVNLTKPDSPCQLDGVTYIGAYVEAETAIRVASGELNPMTKLPITLEVHSNHTPKAPLTTRTPAAVNKSAIETGKGQSIESFFKAKRIPLAELDPNTFTPSPSQVRLLQNNNRGWTSDPAPSRLKPAPLHARENGQPRNEDLPLKPFKRQRLCSEIPEPSALKAESKNGNHRSRFFASSARQLSPSAQRSTRRTRAPKSEIDLWSDDSIDEAALAALPAMSSAPPHPEAVFGSVKKKKISVFTDGDFCYTPATEQKPITALKSTPRSSNKSPENPFTANLMAQTQDLRKKFRFQPLKDSSMSHNVMQKDALEVAKSGLVDIVQAENRAPDPIVVDFKSTPKRPGSKAEAPQPIAPTSVSKEDTGTDNRTSPVSTLEQQDQATYSFESTTSRGSEDTLLVPKSDLDNEVGSKTDEGSDSGVPTSSPPIQEDCSDNDEEQEHRPVLNLRRFAFAAAPG